MINPPLQRIVALCYGTQNHVLRQVRMEMDWGPVAGGRMNFVDYSDAWFYILRLGMFMAATIGLGYMVGRDHGFKRGVKVCISISRGSLVSNRDKRKFEKIDGTGESDLPTF